MNGAAVSRILFIVLLVAGVCLHSYTVLFKGSYGEESAGYAFALGLWVWSLFPYAVAMFMSWKLSYQQQAVGWLVLTLAMDLAMYRSVFVTSASSTAALGLLFMPLWNLILVGPIGALLGWAVKRRSAERAGAL